MADIGEGPDGGRRGLGAQAVTQSHHEVLVHGPQARIACMASGVDQISFYPCHPTWNDDNDPLSGQGVEGVPGVQAEADHPGPGPLPLLPAAPHPASHQHHLVTRSGNRGQW